jgi:hypothetical protein
MDKKLRKMLEQAGTIRHLYNCAFVRELYKNDTSLTEDQIKEIRKHSILEVQGQNVIIYIPEWRWVYDQYASGSGFTGEIEFTEEFENIIVITKKVYRKFIEHPFHYMETINQHIRKYCWQELNTEQKQKQPDLSIENWKDYFMEENATKADVIELYENWIEDKKLILIDEAGTNYRQNFWDRFGHCFDDKIMEVC